MSAREPYGTENGAFPVPQVVAVELGLNLRALTRLKVRSGQLTSFADSYSSLSSFVILPLSILIYN